MTKYLTKILKKFIINLKIRRKAMRNKELKNVGGGRLS